MEISQIPIKINQTNNSDSGKNGTTVQNEDQMNAFDQILALFNFGEKSSKSDETQVTPSLKSDNLTEPDQNDPIKLTEEDWIQFDIILTAMISSIQQAPITQGNNSLDSVESSFNSTQQLLSNDDRESLSRLLQKMEGSNPISTMDSDQIIQGLKKILGELSVLDKEESLAVNTNIEDKIKMILNEIKNKNNNGENQLFNNSLDKDNLLLADKKDVLSSETIPRMSLDKNQVVFSTVPDVGIGNNGESHLVRFSLPKQIDDLPVTISSDITVKQPSNGIENTSVPKTDSQAPFLQVSEFTPEVSGVISRFMRSTNGQSGSTVAKFSLYPEHLGHIEVKITSQDGQLMARIATDTLAAKEMLETQLHQLKEALNMHGILVKKLDIIQQIPMSMDSKQESLPFNQGGSGSFQEQRTFTPEQNLSNKLNENDPSDKEKEMVPYTYGGSTQRYTSNIDFTA